MRELAFLLFLLALNAAFWTTVLVALYLVASGVVFAGLLAAARIAIATAVLRIRVRAETTIAKLRLAGWAARR